MITKNILIKTHRCKESLKQKTSIRLERKWWRNDVSWSVGELDHTDEWDSPYLHQLRASIRYCPFCGKELEAKEEE